MGKQPKARHRSRQGPTIPLLSASFPVQTATSSGGGSPMPLPVPDILLLLLVLVARPPSCEAESATCLAVYREGGAPAVFQSAHCPRWTLPSPGADAGAGEEGDGRGRSRRTSPMGCHVAADRGRRRSQEDRAVCALGIRIPFIGTTH